LGIVRSRILLMEEDELSFKRICCAPHIPSSI